MVHRCGKTVAISWLGILCNESPLLNGAHGPRGLLAGEKEGHRVQLYNTCLPRTDHPQEREPKCSKKPWSPLVDSLAGGTLPNSAQQD